jgi:hypothetical protein
LKFDQVLDLESAAPKETDHVPVPEVEIDFAELAIEPSPLEAMHPEVVAMKRRVGRRVDIVTRVTKLHERRASLEHQSATRSKDPGRLRDPPVRIAPRGSPVLRDREVEGGISERRSLAVSVDQREPQIELLLEKSRRAELIPRVVEGDYAAAAAREPCGNIGSATPDLDRVEARDIR